MNKNDIINACLMHKDHFLSTITEEHFQPRGVLNSEALLMCAVTAESKVPLLIESGRARGHSTNLIAKFFLHREDFAITSIDFDKNSEDTKYSEQYLSKYNNLKLLYGDSFDILPQEITKECVVFIDGPKGDEALILAAQALKNPLVQYVFIHDLHQDTFHRNLCETLFKNTFFSDDLDFVEVFQELDKECWEILSTLNDKPYYRQGKEIASYGSTLAVIKNSQDAINNKTLDNYMAYYHYLNDKSINKFVKSRINHQGLLFKTLVLGKQYVKKIFRTK